MMIFFPVINNHFSFSGGSLYPSQLWPRFCYLSFSKTFFWKLIFLREHSLPMPLLREQFWWLLLKCLLFSWLFLRRLLLELLLTGWLLFQLMDGRFLLFHSPQKFFFLMTMTFLITSWHLYLTLCFLGRGQGRCFVY